MRENTWDMTLVLLNIWKWVKFDKCLTMAFLIKMFSKRIDVTKIFCFSGSDKNIHRKMFSRLCHNKFHNFLGRNAKEFVVTNHSDRNDIEAWIPYTDTISIIGAIASWSPNSSNLRNTAGQSARQGPPKFSPESVIKDPNQTSLHFYRTQINYWSTYGEDQGI